VAELRVDVGVVGGGPAGIAAAVTAASRGRRVALIDEGMRPGGQIWRHTRRADLPARAAHWLARLDSAKVQILAGATVIDADAGPPSSLVVEQGRDRLDVVATTLILATGARERFLPFPGWTLPGVVGAGGAQALLKSGADLSGMRVVIAGTGPLLLAVAGLLARRGVRIDLVADQAAQRRLYAFAASLWRSPGRLAQAARERLSLGATRYAAGTWIVRAQGDERVELVTLTDGIRTWTAGCDLLCVGWGLVPSTELGRLLGCATREGAIAVDAAQRTSLPHILCAGEAAGVAGVDAALVEGEIAGLAAADAWPGPRRLAGLRNRHSAFAVRMDATFALRHELRSMAAPDTIVCRCEDVSFGAVADTSSLREARLRTRAGMGPCQGRVCGTALEFLLGFAPDPPKPPLVPAALTVLAAKRGSTDPGGGKPHEAK
jgi:D-hydroxyproline dehydrogenase subunit alpha